jgi:hypothetical protein
MNLENKTTAQLESRENELTDLMSSLSAWHNRNMSRKDREFFAGLYREESNAIITELMRREA